ncbi:MAG: hypothetical protein SGI77_13505 [Pirellulaceae bacterium]|nr:hypothetical protein [Pirellulaceae bacterium]
MIKNSRLAFPFYGTALLCLLASDFAIQRAVSEEGVARVQLLNYPDCIELKNASTRVVLGHHTGGRVLVYEQHDSNVLYLSPKEAEWNSQSTAPFKEITAGRLDIGPELISKRGPTLWAGTWKAEVIGPRSARLTSKIDPNSGFRITRDFTLDANTSKLSITQTVENAGTEISRHGFWCRAFANHGGIAIVPITPSSSRYPKFYTMGEDQSRVNQKPEDPMIRRDGDFLIVDGPPAFPKLGFDSTAGWFAYQTPQDQLFVMRFSVYPDRVYAEVTGMTLSVWHPNKERVPACELEPIGPMEVLKPGEKASFSVHWWLLDHPFPSTGKIDPMAISQLVETECKQ